MKDSLLRILSLSAFPGLFFGLGFLESYVAVYWLGNFDPKFRDAPDVAFELNKLIWQVLTFASTASYAVGLFVQRDFMRQISVPALATVSCLSAIASFAVFQLIAFVFPLALLGYLVVPCLITLWLMTRPIPGRRVWPQELNLLR
jgi:O-antigen/teichoic acid export membrane protein